MLYEPRVFSFYENVSYFRVCVPGIAVNAGKNDIKIAVIATGHRDNGELSLCELCSV